MAGQRLAAVAAAGLVVSLVAACGSGSPGAENTNHGSPSASPVEIMVSMGLSAQGAIGINANMGANAIKAAVAQVNAAGGVLGRRINATIVDDQGTPTIAVTKLQQAINSGKKPVAWFNGGPADLSAAALPILNQNGILSFNGAPTQNSSDPAKFPLNFDMPPSPADGAKAFCPYAKAQGAVKVAVLYADDAYGDGWAPAVKAACDAASMTVTGSEKYDPQSLDMTAQLERLKSGNPDYLFLDGYGAPVGYILKGIVKIGWNVKVLGDGAVAATSVVTQPPANGGLGGTAAVQNLKLLQPKSAIAEGANEQSERLNKMISELKAQGPIRTSLSLAYQYDGIMLFVAAMKKANSTTDTKAIAQALQDLGGQEVGAVYPTYGFTADSHSANQPADAFSFVAPSKQVDGQLTGKSA